MITPHLASPGHIQALGLICEITSVKACLPGEGVCKQLCVCTSHQPFSHVIIRERARERGCGISLLPFILLQPPLFPVQWEKAEGIWYLFSKYSPMSVLVQDLFFLNQFVFVFNNK